MPRRRRNGRNNRSRNNGRNGENHRMTLRPFTAGSSGNDRTTIVGKGTMLFNFAMGSNLATIPLSLNSLGNDRFNQMQEIYQLFRFVRLRMRVVPYNLTGFSLGSGLAQLFVLCFVQGIPSSGPASVSAGMQLNNSITFNPERSIISELNLGRAALLADTPSKWYRTQPSATVEAWEEQQGTLYLVAGSNASASADYYIQFEYELELTSTVLTTMVPQLPPFSHASINYILEKVRSAYPLLSITPYGSNFTDKH